MTETGILRGMFEGIRDEKRTAANTAVRIGNAFLALLDMIEGTLPGIYLSKIDDDEAQGHITFLKGLTSNLLARLKGGAEFGRFVEGLTGAKIDAAGNAELRELYTRAVASLESLVTRGDAEFWQNLASKEFISGFLDGMGWAIQRKPYVNAAGETEYHYTLEIDNVTVRRLLRVYELVASQLRGENDNVVFAARMKVDHYDAATGRVWLDTEGESLYNVFRRDDCIMVQRFQPGNDVVHGGDGYVTKSYELLIDEVGSGGATNEAGERLDWVTFRNFTSEMEGASAAELIKRNDTFVRVDNLTDPERKGIVTIMTVGTNMPYIDIVYGLKTDPQHALKGRMGNLEGIRSELFGWLEGFGEYLTNLYAVGKFYNFQTGESLTSYMERTEQRYLSAFRETAYLVTDADNFVHNGTFLQDDASGEASVTGMDGWLRTDGNGDLESDGDDMEQEVIGFGGEPVLVNGLLTSWNIRQKAEVVMFDGKPMLHLDGKGVRQLYTLMKKRGTHAKSRYEVVNDDTPEADLTATDDVPDTLYLSIRILPITDGRLTVTFYDGTDIRREEETLTASLSYQMVQWSDEHDPYAYDGGENGHGHMTVTYTGECYISLIALTRDPVSSMMAEYSTRIEQTSRYIRLWAKATLADAGAVREQFAQIEVRADQIQSQVTEQVTRLDGRVDSAESSITQTARSIRAEVSEVNDGIINLADYTRWEQGWFGNGQTGKTYDQIKVADTQKIRYKSLVAVTGDTTFVINNGYYVQFAYFNADRQLCSTGGTYFSGWKTVARKDGKVVDSAIDIHPKDGKASDIVKYVALCVWKEAGGAVSPTDITASGIGISNGKIASTSWVEQTASSILSTVTSNREAAEKAIEERRQELEAYKKDNDKAVSAAAAWIDQSKDYVDIVARNWDKNGNILNGSSLTVLADGIKSEVKGYTDGKLNSYSTTEQTSELIRQAVQNFVTNEDLNGKGYATTSALNETANSITARVEAMETTAAPLDTDDAWVTGEYISTTAGKPYTKGSDGCITSANSWSRTKELWPITSKAWISGGSTRYRVVFFDASKKSISTRTLSGAQSNTELAVPANAQYVGIAIQSTTPSEIGVTLTTGTPITSAEISTFLSKDDLGNVQSNAFISADNIDFEFTKEWKVNAKGKGTVMSLDTAGNLSIAGTLTQGSITGDIQIGTGTNKMYIKPTATGGAELIGMAGNTQTLSLGFRTDSTTSSALMLPDVYHMYHGYAWEISNPGMGSGYTENIRAIADGQAMLTFLQGNSNTAKLGFTALGVFNFGATMSSWPRNASDVSVGGVFVDSNSILRVRTS